MKIQSLQKEAYSIFTEDMKKSPNTRACIFGTLHVPATEILMEQLDKNRNKRLWSAKVKYGP